MEAYQIDVDLGTGHLRRVDHPTPRVQLKWVEYLFLAMDRRAKPLYYGGRLPGAVWLILQIGQSNIPSGTQATLMISYVGAGSRIDEMGLDCEETRQGPDRVGLVQLGLQTKRPYFVANTLSSTVHR